MLKQEEDICCMKYIENQLSKIKPAVSKIGLGTARFGSRMDIQKAFELLDVFYEKGGSVLDTARNYDEWAGDGRGKSEECIGKWLSQNGNRKEMVLCTKGGVRRSKMGERYFDLSSCSLCEEVKESLEALQTDYIDIYLLHKDEKSRNVEEIVETMQKVCEIGKISAIGVANWTVQRLKAANDYARKNGYKEFQIVQTWWSLAEYTKEMWNDENTTHMTKEMYGYMMENQLLGMAYTAQCKGFFQKAIQDGIENIDEFLKKRIVTPKNIKKLRFIEEYCIKNSVHPTAIVNSYITDNLLQGIALVSCSSVEQLKEIMEWDDYILNQKVIEELDAI